MTNVILLLNLCSQWKISEELIQPFTSRDILVTVTEHLLAHFQENTCFTVTLPCQYSFFYFL